MKEIAIGVLTQIPSFRQQICTFAVERSWLFSRKSCTASFTSKSEWKCVSCNFLNGSKMWKSQVDKPGHHSVCSRSSQSIFYGLQGFTVEMCRRALSRKRITVESFGRYYVVFRNFFRVLQYCVVLN